VAEMGDGATRDGTNGNANGKPLAPHRRRGYRTRADGGRM
jgi:hypothetical protein